MSKLVLYDRKAWTVVREKLVNGTPCYDLERRTPGRLELTFAQVAWTTAVEQPEAGGTPPDVEQAEVASNE